MRMDERRMTRAGVPTRTGEGRRERHFARRLGLAWTGLLAAVLVSPIAITCCGAFSTSEWYGQRSEGARVAGTGRLFCYVLDIWGGALLHSVEIVVVVFVQVVQFCKSSEYWMR